MLMGYGIKILDIMYKDKIKMCHKAQQNNFYTEQNFW